jgi:hypothetical protein
MSEARYAETYIGVMVTQDMLYRMEATRTDLCGHQPENTEHKFCPECGIRMSDRYVEEETWHMQDHLKDLLKGFSVKWEDLFLRDGWAGVELAGFRFFRIKASSGDDSDCPCIFGFRQSAGEALERSCWEHEETIGTLEPRQLNELLYVAREGLKLTGELKLVTNLYVEVQ